MTYQPQQSEDLATRPVAAKQPEHCGKCDRTVLWPCNTNRAALDCCEPAAKEAAR